MKKLLLIISAILSLAHMQAQVTDGYLTDGDIVSIRYINKWNTGTINYISLSQSGISTLGYVDENCLWRLGITRNGNNYEYTFEHIATGMYLRAAQTSNQQTANITSGTEANKTAFRFDHRASVKNSHLMGKFGCILIAWGQQKFACLTQNGNTLQFCPWNEFDVYIEKWTQSGSGDGTLKGYFSPELQKFGWAIDDAAARDQKKDVKFVFPTHIHSSYHCVNRPELVLGGSETEITKFPTPTFYWKSQGKNDNYISILNPANYQVPAGAPAIERRNMLEVSKPTQDANDKNIWNFTITPLNKSPKNLQRKDAHSTDANPIYRWVNYMDTLVAEYTYDGQNYTIYMVVERNSYHDAELPSLVISVNPHSYTFARTAETLNIQVTAVHQHGKVVYDVEGNAVETVYDEGFTPTPISAINDNGWTTKLEIDYGSGEKDWITSAAVINSNTIQVKVPAHEGNKRSAILKGTLFETEHEHSGTFEVQLHQRGKEGGIDFKTQLGAGNKVEDHEGWEVRDPQPVHTAERTIYYTKGQQIELKLAESGFSGYMRWYDYETGGSPHYNDRHGTNYPSTNWHTQPRSADGKWFVNINTPQNSGTVDDEGYSWGLYALHKSAKDKAGRQLTAAMGAILDETYKTNDRLAQPSPVLYGWNYTYDANASTPEAKRAAGYHTMACDVSAYTDYEIITQDDNTSRITSIKEPTLSYRQLFHLKPAEEIADKFAALADGKYLEEYSYMAPVGPDVYLSTEFRHAAKQPETEKCYFYWKDGNKNELLRVNGDARWYDESGNNITPGTYNAKDYLDVDAQSPGTKTYYLRVPNALGTGKHLNIAKFTVEFVHANACGPSAGLISKEQIYAQYKVLKYIDFSFGAEAPNTEEVRTLSKPLPWEYATYGFVYPSDITGDGEEDYVRGDSQGEFPYFGEYRLVNNVNKNFGGSAGVSGENHGGASKGYAMYVDGTMEPGMVASISTNTVICSAQTLYCSMWLRNPSSTAHSGALPIFRCNIQGRKKTNPTAGDKTTYTEWEDAGVFFVGSLQKNSGWQQIVFPVNSATNYDETRVSLYNFATDNMANDFMIDDICLFVSQLPFAAYQGKMACRTTADSKTHAVAVLRLDYSKIDKDNDGFMYYQIYNTTTKTEVNLTGSEDGAKYYHEKHPDGEHDDEHHYGSISIPDANYTPQQGDKTYQSVTKFVDDLMASGNKNDKAYIQVDNDGVTKWLLYVGHIIENTAESEKANTLLFSQHDYLIRMAHTPNELDKAECNMQTPLHATQSTTFELKNSDNEIIKHTNENGTLIATKEQSEGLVTKIFNNSTNNCANDLYFLTTKIHNSLALKVGGEIKQVAAPIYSDWFVMHTSWEGMEVYAEEVPTDPIELKDYKDRLAVADAKFKEIYKYTRGEIAAAIMHDMRRVPTDDDRNLNYYAKSFKELIPEQFQTHENYNIIKHLHDNGWLEMNKTTIHFYLGSETTARYWAYPIEGTAKTTIEGHDGEIVLMDCKEALWVTISSMQSDYYLNIAPITNTEKTEQQKVQLPTVKVLAGNESVIFPIPNTNTVDRGATTNISGENNSQVSLSLSDLTFMDMNIGCTTSKPQELLAGEEYTVRVPITDEGNFIYPGTNNPSSPICRVGYVFFHLLVIPNTLVWTPEGASFNGWGKDENWRGWIDNGDGVIADNELTEGYVPISGANVVIPKLENTVLYPYIVLDHEHNHYPMTIGFEPHHCKNIYFAPGAKLYNQHLLEYENAFVDMQFTAAKWQMVSAPLQGMVSGDMFVPHDGWWDSGSKNLVAEPNPFEVKKFEGTDYQGIRHADAAYAFWEAFYESDVKGSNTLVRGFDNVTFTQSNSLIQPLNIGKGYMVYGLGHEEAEQLTVRLPKPDTEYYYYNEGNKDVSSSVKITSTNRSKLAYTADHNQQDMTIQLTKKADSEYFLFGNPTMAFVDMHALYLDHQNQWTGEFKTMINGQFNASVQGTLSTADRYLPPMTSALLKSNIANATSMDITLKPSHITLDNTINFTEVAEQQPQQAPARRIAGIDERPVNYEALQSELMTIYAFTPKGTARTVLATNPAANDYYTSGEDALFTSSGVENESYGTTPLNMYTVAEQVPMMADVRQGISEIPLGILAASNVRSEYMQVAFYLSANWTRECYFCDSKTGQKIRIMDGLVISVEMPQNHEQRYSIEGPDTYRGSDGVTTSTTQPTLSTTGNKVWAYAPDRSTVVVSSTDLIKSATLYDITGRLVASSPLNSHLMTNSLTLHTAGTAGVYIVDVTLRDGSTERAQVIVQ